MLERGAKIDSGYEILIENILVRAAIFRTLADIHFLVTGCIAVFCTQDGSSPGLE
jgi:hypothetical protein